MPRSRSRPRSGAPLAPGRRLCAGLLALALTYPFVRAAVCDAGRHEHGHGPPTVEVVTAGQGAEDGADCHALMACGVTSVAIEEVAPEGLQVADRGQPADARLVPLHAVHREPPSPPPPRA